MAFLKLGLTSFGGAIAHLGYFRDELVIRRGWIEDADYAELVALCQFLPGPASSQVGFALGLARAGPLGAFAAWTAFTLPSAVIMLLLALGSSVVAGLIADVVFHGFKLVAVVIVVQAVWGMARTLSPDLRRATITLVAGVTALLAGGVAGQVGAIMLGAGAGILFCRHLTVASGSRAPILVPRRAGVVCLALFALLLIGLPALAAALEWRGLDLFYRAGALVFGGGHVVLPLLRAELVVPGWIGDDRFLAGYGAAQALPGPLFAISTYLGAVAGNGMAGAAAALIGIFLPGLLLLIGTLPFWAALRTNAHVRSAIMGANAAVVGILALALALYDRLWATGVETWHDALLVGIGLFALMRWSLPPVVIVVAIVTAAVAIGTG